jgi:hypothetical protein
VKELCVKEEEMEMPAPEEDERPWWVKERDLQNAARHPDDPEDAPGLHVLARSYTQAQPMPGQPRGWCRIAATSSTSPRTTSR